MKVSIVIPIYNVEPYIERCLKSVMMQEYPDIECILVDDGSPDHSIDVCKRLIANYKGPIEFRILRHTHNRGLSAARNTGTEAATGTYVYYLDSDDEITPKCISLMSSEVTKHPGVEMVVGNAKTIPPIDWPGQPTCNQYMYVENPYWTCYLFNKQKMEFPISACNKLTLISFLRSNNISFKEGLIHEDELWSCITVRHLKKTAILPNQTYIYHSAVAGSITHSTPWITRFRNCLLVFTEIVLSIDDSPTAMLQFYRAYIYYLFGFYSPLSKRDYQRARQIACQFLFRKHKYLTAIYTHVFFKWNTALGLRKYQSKLEAHIKGRYRHEENKVARLVQESPDSSFVPNSING